MTDKTIPANWKAAAIEPTVSYPVLRVLKLTRFAQLPKRSSSGAAGYDLYAAHPIVIPARSFEVVPLDICLGIPAGHYGRMASRSSLTVKYRLEVGAGVIDEDYRGPIHVAIYNHSDCEYCVDRGDRIAQLIIEKILYPLVIETDSLDKTERDQGWCGSTGK